MAAYNEKGFEGKLGGLPDHLAFEDVSKTDSTVFQKLHGIDDVQVCFYLLLEFHLTKKVKLPNKDHVLITF